MMCKGQYRSAGAGLSYELDLAAVKSAMDALEVHDPAIMYRVMLVAREVAAVTRKK